METIITTSSSKNYPYVHALGATHAINYHDLNVFEQVMDITNQQGVDVSLDCVGRDNDILAASVLRYEGCMVELVKTLTPNNYQDAFTRGLSFHQLSLGSGHRYGAYGRNTIIKAGIAISAMLEEGQLNVPKLEIVNFKDIGGALIDMRNERTVGKIVAKLI
ncbi:zinc-binding dehydrogenase [Vibrio algarum]|uniref:Zinc-binding dehydrogenase n=1 Tax=Vibrio algarum TaxID=3020714 RepID=A0ABT4YUZ1_9VIBR|nr:zinc-binding dehydrogenase [Vibrio sp. KJ40-1]MDB1125358.1 zinc-binding dehydrogenase [Vibrio sp. KJ40-1]